MKLGHKVVRNKHFWSEFLISHIHILYNTANNAVSYIQKQLFIVKIVLFKKCWLEISIIRG